MRLKKLPTNWKKWFKLLGFLLLLLVLFWWLKSDFWLIKKVECQFDGDGCPIEILNKANSLSLRKNILFLPKSKIKGALKREYPQIYFVEIKRKLPQALVFNLSSRKVVAALAVELFLDTDSESTESAKEKESETNLSGVFYLVDEQGVVLEKANEAKGLPLILINYDPGLNFGDQIKEDKIIKTIEILLGLKLRLIEPRIARVTSFKKIEVWLDNNLLVLFNLELEKGIDEQLDSLQLISSRAKIEGKQIKKIDLRFNKPVIAY